MRIRISWGPRNMVIQKVTLWGDFNTPIPSLHGKLWFIKQPSMDSNMCQSPTNNHGFWVDIGVQGLYLKDMAGSYWHRHPCPAFQSSAAISWWKRAPWLFCLSGNCLRQKGNANFLGRSKCCSISQPETRSFWMNLIRTSLKVAWSMPGNLPLVGKQSDLSDPPHRSWVFGLNSTYVHLHIHTHVFGLNSTYVH